MNKIDAVQNINFKGSRVNIVSLADIHGDILKVPQVIKSIQVHSKDLFEKAGDKSSLNLLAIAGDVFMNPKKRGFITQPSFCAGDIQYNFLTGLIFKTKMAVAKVASTTAKNFETIFAIGNHDLEGGDDWLFDKLKRAPMTTLMTNINKAKSPIVSQAMEEMPEKFVTSKVFEIPDDKVAGKVNKLLVLSATIPSMDYYCPNLLKGTTFYDNCNKNDASLEEKDLKKTISIIKQQVEKFKEENPKGSVIMLSHIGNRISTMIAKKVPEINLILNGHDHKGYADYVGKTIILSHGQNGEFYRGIHFNINDDGTVSVHSDRYNTQEYDQPARKDKKMQEFVNVNIKEDLKPLHKFDITKINRDDYVLNDSIRYSHNLMANYITSGMKEAALKYYPELDAIGIPTTIFRNGILSNDKRTTINNVDYLKIFDGVNATIADLKVGTISGLELYGLVLENVLNNLKSKTRNALIQWSDIRIDRTKIRQLKDNNFDPELSKAIQIRNPQTGEFEEIDPRREYQIILSDKYLLKKPTKNLSVPNEIKGKFKPIGKTYDELFKEYLESVNYDVDLTTDLVTEKRIL